MLRRTEPKCADGEFGSRHSHAHHPDCWQQMRHETLQRFMLTNDSVTVAIVVTIRLTVSHGT
jgi:hypothetical protein